MKTKLCWLHNLVLQVGGEGNLCKQQAFGDLLCKASCLLQELDTTVESYVVLPQPTRRLNKVS